MATGSKTRTRLPAAERRARILESAKQVFADRGYHEASIGEISKAAGISPAVVYDHFDSKAELQIILLERETEELLGFVGAAVQAAPEALPERMRAGVDAFFVFVEEHTYAWRMLFRDPPTDPAVTASYHKIHVMATGGIALFLRASAPEELLAHPDSDRDLEMFAQLLKMAQNGLASWWWEHPDVPREVLVDRMLEFCWIGLERVAGGERI
jgi:AcrR family transcriptional regulator